jgi:hypothetical protein
VTIAVLGLGALAGLAVIEAAIRRSDVAALLVLGLLVIQESSLFSLSFDGGPVRVGAGDLLFVALLTAAMARLLRIERLGTAQRLLVTFGVLVVWALLRGVGQFGLPPAVNEARSFLLFTATVLYFSTVEARRDLLDRVGTIWLGAAVLLSGLALLRWFANAVGVTGGIFGSGGSIRVLHSATTLIIAQGALIALPLLPEPRRRLSVRFLSPVLLAFVLVLQHRTVWVVTAAAVVYLLYRERKLATRALPALGLGVVVFAVLVFTVFGDGEEAISEQLASSAQSTATFEWRLQGWSALVTESGPEGPAEVVTGQPFGGGWARTMPNGNVVAVSPHSFYVEPYMRVGAAGLIVLLMLYAIALRGTLNEWRARSSGGATSPEPLLRPHVLHAALAAQLLYYVTYTPDAAQALLLGLGLAIAVPLVARQPANDSVQVTT